jgi:hypothetical protein
MTTRQLVLIICTYSVALVAVVYFTRAHGAFGGPWLVGQPPG